jgi:hypothetical protein
LNIRICGGQRLELALGVGEQLHGGGVERSDRRRLSKSACACMYWRAA